MDKIGPLTFNGARFFIGFLSIIPIALMYENSKIIKEINNNRTEFFKLLFWIGLFLFLGTFVQQAALLYTDIANAAFFTVFYVPMVPIILYIFYKKKYTGVYGLQQFYVLQEYIYWVIFLMQQLDLVIV